MRALVVLAVFSGCLFGYALRHHGPLQNAVSAFESVLQPATQWICFLLVCFWCAGLIILTRRARDGWLVGLLAILVFAYAAQYRDAASDSSAVILLLAVTIGKAARLIRPRPLMPVCLLGLLTVASCQAFGGGSDYGSGFRWTGLWDDPNTYGMLAGAGFLLALGAAIYQRRRYTLRLLAAGAAVLFGVGLLKSYSRGAWCGVLVGLICFLLQLPKVRPRMLIAMAGISLGAVLLAGFQGVTWHPIHRAISVLDQNDFSWRNRLTAWKGGLQIMAQCPWRGVGWTRAEKVYEDQYLPARLAEGALFTNSYFVLGSQLGLPALVCLIVYFWLNLAGEPRSDGPGPNAGLRMQPPSWIQVGCRTGAIALAVGILFDGGFFVLSTAATFWILLELGSFAVMEHPDSGIRELAGGPAPGFVFGGDQAFGVTTRQNILWGGTALLVFVGTLYGAKQQDPFIRKSFAIETPGYGLANGAAVLPKPLRRCPMIVFACGRGGALINGPGDLRSVAELGLAAVSFECAATQAVAFETQFEVLLRYLGRQKWIDPNGMAWVACGPGVGGLVESALRHPDSAPRLLVLVTGAGQFTNETELANRSSPPVGGTRFEGRVLVVESDPGPSSSDPAVDRFLSIERANGQPIDRRKLPGGLWGFDSERQGVLRCVGEYCLTHLTRGDAWSAYRSLGMWEKEAVPLWHFGLPAVGWFLAGWIWVRPRRTATANEPGAGRFERVLCWFAGAVSVLALAVVALHVVMPGRMITDRTLGIAREFLVRPEERSDFEWMAVQPTWQNQKLGVLLEHVRLARYNRQLVNWCPDGELYWDYVLSAVIDPSAPQAASDSSLNWRRSLWEEFYPRIRHESSLEDAARIVVRHLRERVTIADLPNLPHDVPAIWLRQITDETGFEIIYVAALRSVGVPARLDSRQQAEFWEDNKWQIAPRPSVVRW